MKKQAIKKIEFESLKIQRATDIIENRISSMIIRGAIKPGEKLPTEKGLSNQFNVSVVTIREALRGLEVAGLIKKKRGKGGGIYITELNNDSIKTTLSNFLRRNEFSAYHLAQVRLTIEPTIVRLAASEITSEELLSLENNLSYCEDRIEKAGGVLQVKDCHAIGEKNLEFHSLIAQSTHNPVFALTTDYLMDFIFYFKKSSSPETALCTRVVEEHRDIFISLKEGNAEEAEARMLQHLKYLEAYQMSEGF